MNNYQKHWPLLGGWMLFPFTYSRYVCLVCSTYSADRCVLAIADGRLYKCSRYRPTITQFLWKYPFSLLPCHYIRYKRHLLDCTTHLGWSYPTCENNLCTCMVYLFFPPWMTPRDDVHQHTITIIRDSDFDISSI